MTDKTMNHTPGPWTTAGRFAPVYVVDANGHTIADCDQIAGLPDHDAPNQIANAALIAAAPDLLAALKALLAKHDDRDGLSDLWPVEAAAARATIAKATGGQS